VSKEIEIYSEIRLIRARCALVEKWRIHIGPGQDQDSGTDIKDPEWLIAVNAVS
jgi:hypothetical protein